MNSIHRTISHDQVLDGVDINQGSIEAFEAALVKDSKSEMPVIWTSVLISLCLSVLGFFALMPPSEFLPLFALLAGFATAMLNGGFWTFMFKRARDAQTHLGALILVLLFVFGGLIATLPSTGTNLAGFIVDASNTVNQAERIESYSVAINKTNEIATQLTNLSNTLEGHETSFNTRFQDEVKGRGSTGKPGEGYVSNALLEAKNLFAGQRASLASALVNFEKLKGQLDTKFAAWQEAQRSGNFEDKGFDKHRTELGSLIAQIAAINPKSIATNIADQIDINVTLPNGAKRFQTDAIEAIRSEIWSIAKNIRASENGFDDIQAPKKEVSSKITLAWQNALQFWPMTILAIGIDLISPLLFLMKLPSYLAIHAQRKALAARASLVRREMAFHRAPKPVDTMGLVLNDAVEFAHAWRSFQQQVIELSVQGQPSLSLEEDFYAPLVIKETDIENDEDLDDESHIEEFWKDEEEEAPQTPSDDEGEDK